MFNVSGTRSGRFDELLNNTRAFAVFEVEPIAVDKFGLPRADEVCAIVVVDKEEPFIAVDHCRQDLRDLIARGLIVWRGGAIDKIEPIACLGQVVPQFAFLGFDQLGFQNCDLAIRHGAALVGHKKRNGRRRQNQRHGGQQKQPLAVGDAKAVDRPSHANRYRSACPNQTRDAS